MLVDGVRKIYLYGVEHWVRVAGAAHDTTPLVLVHGGPGGSSYPYEAIGDQLAQRSTVVFYDQRGCGRSARPASELSGYTVTQLVMDLDALRAQFGLERMSLWGVSHGCLIAAEYAVAHPDRVDRLVLQAPTIVGPLHPGVWSMRPAAADTIASPVTRAKLRAALAGVDDAVKRLWTTVELLAGNPTEQTRYLYHDPAVAATITDDPDLEFNEQMCRAIIGTERDTLLDDLAGLDLPALIMVGLWDRNAGVDICRDLMTRMPRGELHLFAHSAHMPHDEEPDEYVAAVRAFLDR